MIHDMRRKGLAAGLAAISLLVGGIAGFFAAHRMMGGVVGMTMERQGETAAPPSGAVAIPAVARQLIGVRSAPATHVTLEEQIRTVGTVGYDERGFTQVTLKTPGWVREVFVNSIGRPVRKGDPLLTFYSPDLLATQDEYLLAVNAQGQLADSPLAEVKANAASLVAGARERLRLWDLTDAQIGALERRGGPNRFSRSTLLPPEWCSRGKPCRGNMSNRVPRCTRLRTSRRSGSSPTSMSPKSRR